MRNRASSRAAGDWWLAGLLMAAFVGSTRAADETAPVRIGTQGAIGCGPDAKQVKRLVICEPGVYENILVDGAWGDSTLVKIKADDVTLRNCEIRHGRHNAVTVSAKNVVIESCRTHHVLAGSFKQQKDAHGITGCPTNLTVRNCDIGWTSGDYIQFDPGRGAWDQVLIENCTLYDSLVAVRAEDGIENLKLRRLGVGAGIRRTLQNAGSGTGSGFENVEEHTPPPYDEVIHRGLLP